ncbi:copper resistance protein CopD [Halovenus sp. WSH3]|uniref:Copper resistance protein CopD n=1 Tax=Halovenus carboxidivorans TaxID=2692199 RepID=A0A6B0T7R1_9EURY|nr:copper resistance protein CopD [Halovenus carboxidivorans]MXR52246.1 copper resistance protein CopD [Halovenus carboxidivorans]
MALLTLAYVLHVLSAALWTGATLYVVYAVLPGARAGRLGPAAFTEQLHRLLLITRWTGVVLPLTGGYMIWVRYPLPLLLDTPRGWAVLAMLSLWGIMNTLIEIGVLRMRRVGGPVGIGTYLQEGFPVERLPPGIETATLLGRVRPYLLASAACAVLLLGDAALLAVGL